VINRAQQLLRDGHTNVNGLYDTVLVAASNVQRHNDDVGNTVQIVFDFLHQHWFTVTDKHCGPGCLSIYCSMQMLPSSSCLSTIAKLFHVQTSSITINVLNVAKQRGSKDCGFFAIAYAEMLIRDQDPCNVCFDQPKMRSHLKTVLKRNGLIHFRLPSTGLFGVLSSVRLF
jgi:hypothetical protein